MSKRYEYYLGSMSIKDNETNKVYDYVEDLLNEQDQKIKDLEHRLSNCIEPKFKIGQEVWFLWGKDIKSFIISRIQVEIRNCILIAYSNSFFYQYEENCFATKEEAKAKLEELKNG